MGGPGCGEIWVLFWSSALHCCHSVWFMAKWITSMVYTHTPPSSSPFSPSSHSFTSSPGVRWAELPELCSCFPHFIHGRVSQPSSPDFPLPHLLSACLFCTSASLLVVGCVSQPWSPDFPLPHLTSVCLFCTSPSLLVCSRQGVSGSLRALGLCSPPGSSVSGISQARILEWVAIPFSRGSSRPGIKLGFPVWPADSLPTEPLCLYPCPANRKDELLLRKLTFLYGSAAEATSANLYGQRFSMENQKCTMFWKGLGKQGV